MVFLFVYCVCYQQVLKSNHETDIVYRCLKKIHYYYSLLTRFSNNKIQFIHVIPIVFHDLIYKELYSYIFAHLNLN